MLDRNRRIKDRPERFQDCKDHFDVVIALEERVYDQIMEGKYILLYLMSFSPLHGRIFCYGTQKIGFELMTNAGENLAKMTSYMVCTYR